jgi:hypothetical protein
MTDSLQKVQQELDFSVSHQLAGVFSSSNSNNTNSNSSCCLLLVDRLEDLHSALHTSGPSHPLVQRIINTLYTPSTNSSTSSPTTIDISHAVVPSYIHTMKSLSASNNSRWPSIERPMSGLLGVGRGRRPPTICIRTSSTSTCTSSGSTNMDARLAKILGTSNSTNSSTASNLPSIIPRLSRALYLQSESSSHALVVSALKEIVSVEHGSYVHKKRGMGAEILALLSAVLDSNSSSNSSSSTSTNVGHRALLSTRYSSIISLSCALIEVWQRSAAKLVHTSTTNSFRLAYELRQARQQRLYNVINASNSVIEGLEAIIDMHKELVDSTSGTSGSNVPVDITQMMCLVLRYVHIFIRLYVYLISFLFIFSLLSRCRLDELSFPLSEALAPVLLELLPYSRLLCPI